jgi:hypothetical protein
LEGEVEEEDVEDDGLVQNEVDNSCEREEESETEGGVEGREIREKGGVDKSFKVEDEPELNKLDGEEVASIHI